MAATSSVHADVIADLDHCLADPAQTLAVFTERFPHERCDIGTTCDPNLVQSAATIARQRCRITAIDMCQTAPDTTACSDGLAGRWQDMASDLSADIQTRWTRLDQTKLSPFAVRRFENPKTYLLETLCPDMAQVQSTTLSQDTLCALFSGVANITRMEGLSNYLADQEARQ